MEGLRELMAKMEKAPEDFASAILGAAETTLSRRPDEKNWAAKEILCHMRDTEELFINRLKAIVESDEPRFSPAEADRWAAERQYLRNDAEEALSSFRIRRGETLEFLGGLRPEEWQRAGIHSIRGRETLKDWVAMIVKHDINHLDQLKRALAGQA